MKKLILALTAVSLLAAPAAQAQDGDVYRPAGDWVADFGDDYCRLVRNFSNGRNQISLGFERVQPGPFTRLIFVGDGISPFRRATEIGYNFLPSGNTRQARYVKSETGDGKQYLAFDQFMLAPPGPPAPGTPPGPPPLYNRQQEQEAARALTGIALSEGLTDAVRFETGSLRPVVATMQACADDLLTVWGLDAEKHKTMTVPAIMTPVDGGVLPQGTIPFTEFEKFLGGANQVRLIIGADGKPTSCTIYNPSLSQSLNNRICNLAMSKAAFIPAKDAAGQPMASYWMGSPLFLGPPLRR
jgi:hypothetical protein